MGLLERRGCRSYYCADGWGNIFRRGLNQLLNDSFDEVVVHEAYDGNEVVNKVSENKYDVLLLDIAMPGRSGLDVLKDIKKEYPKLSVLILSGYPEEQYAIRALKSGASGYLTKKSVAKELVEAVKKVSKGEIYLTASIAERLTYAIREDTQKAPHEKLSNREYEVMCMIASGKRVTEIAIELCLSKKTISTHRTHILEKMRLKNNAEITYYAIKRELVD